MNQSVTNDLSLHLRLFWKEKNIFGKRPGRNCTKFSIYFSTKCEPFTQSLAELLFAVSIEVCGSRVWIFLLSRFWGMFHDVTSIPCRVAPYAVSPSLGQTWRWTKHWLWSIALLCHRVGHHLYLWSYCISHRLQSTCLIMQLVTEAQYIYIYIYILT